MNKRSLIFILLSLFTICLFAQEKDRRAEFLPRCRENISITPDERIFIVSYDGEIFCADNIKTPFKKKQQILYKSEVIDDFLDEYPMMNRISFFNNDTAIITGYIQSDTLKYSKENGYYYIQLSTKDVKQLSFDKNEGVWIYDVCIMSDGKAWMGGSNGNIYYTSNFGKSWNKLNSPLDSKSRTRTLFMINANEGIVGGGDNNLYITKDNWKSYSKIETPLDQNLFTYKNLIRFKDFDKIRIWKDYYIVNQDKKVFYSKIDNIKWKEFNINLIDFEIDRDSNSLFAVTKENNIIKFESIENYSIISSLKKKIMRIYDMKVVNNSVYLLFSDYSLSNIGYSIAKINNNDIFITSLFRDDKKIEIITYEYWDVRPIKIKNNIVKGKNIIWAFNNNFIYLTEIDKQDWYREAQLNYYIEDLFLQNDSTAIVWNGKDNYIYSTSTKKDILYYPKNPLSSFLLYPINKIEIKEGGAGDGYYRSHLVNYKSTDNFLKTKKITKENSNDSDDKKFKNQVSLDEIVETLKQFSNNPRQLPHLKDFNITEKDKKDYILLIDSLFNSKYSNDYKKFKKDTSLFYNIYEIIDTISNETFTAFITRDRDSWSTSRRWFEINFINSNNDTVQMYNYWYRANAFYFPLTIKYKEQYINSYNLPLSLLIKKLYPFTDKFENKKLLLDIVTYLYFKNEYQ